MKIRARRDRDKNGGGLIEFVKRGFICTRNTVYEPITSECICSEFTISKRKWICFSVYRSPNNENLLSFFDELTLSLTKATLNYENIIVMGDFNIDINKGGQGYDKLDEFLDLFTLTNLIKSCTCFTKNHASTIDLFLTNKPLLFQKTTVCETGLSDYHKLISTFFKSSFF